MARTVDLDFDQNTKSDILAMIFKVWMPEPKTELVTLDESIGRFSASDVVSKVNLPTVRCSKMDGFAVKSADFTSGHPDTSHWVEGVDYARADTGDDFDDIFDAVVRVEDVEINEAGHLQFAKPEQVKAGFSVNGPGDKLAKGERLIAANQPIRPSDISNFAMGGVGEVPVRVKPKVAFIPTGSELVEAGNMPQRGQIIDSNSIFIKHYVQDLGGDVLLQPIVADDKDKLRASLLAAAAAADIVVINGGSSKGSEDFNATLLEELADNGKLITHGVCAAPGKPIAITIIKGKPVINIPGPDMALFHSLEWCINPLVRHFMGVPARIRQVVRAKLTDGFVGPGVPLEIKPGKPFELMRRVWLRRASQNSDEYIATPISFTKSEVLRIPGCSTGQIIGEPTEDEVTGAYVNVEVLSPLEFLV